jgi:hypothetical protein
MVMRVFYYLGVTLVFAGLGIYIHIVWDDLSSLSRVLITLGTGFVAYLLGILFARDKHLEKAATPAHILAFLLQPVGMFVLLREYFHGNDFALGAMVVFGPLAVQQVLTFAAQRAASSSFENATRLMFTAFSISSIDMKMMMMLRRIMTPATPMMNSAAESSM